MYWYKIGYRYISIKYKCTGIMEQINSKSRRVVTCVEEKRRVRERDSKKGTGSLRFYSSFQS